MGLVIEKISIYRITSSKNRLTPLKSIQRLTLGEESNIGSKRHITEIISLQLQFYDAVIVLEDDLEVGIHFELHAFSVNKI